MQSACLICKRIEMIQKGTNPYFVAERETGYVVIGDQQFFRGYTLFLSKIHATELHELDQKFKLQFLKEMSEVAEAVCRAFKPVKLNYELLGNTDRHLHWHLFPRHTDDPKPNCPVWMIDHQIRNADSTKPSREQLTDLVEQLRRVLKSA